MMRMQFRDLVDETASGRQTCEEREQNKFAGATQRRGDCEHRAGPDDGGRVVSSGGRGVEFGEDFPKWAAACDWEECTEYCVRRRCGKSMTPRKSLLSW